MITFLDPIPEWPVECEFNAKGTYDFWFVNTHDVPLKVGMKELGCGCSDASLGLLDANGFPAGGLGPSRTWATLPRSPACDSRGGRRFWTACSTTASPPSRPANSWTKRCAASDPLSARPVPAGRARPRPELPGVLRLVWKNEKPNEPAKRLWADLWCLNDNGDRVIVPRIEVKTALVAPVVGYPDFVDLQTLSPGRRSRPSLTFGLPRGTILLYKRGPPRWTAVSSVRSSG